MKSAFNCLILIITSLFLFGCAEKFFTVYEKGSVLPKGTAENIAEKVLGFLREKGTDDRKCFVSGHRFKGIAERLEGVGKPQKIVADRGESDLTVAALMERGKIRTVKLLVVHGVGEHPVGYSGTLVRNIVTELGKMEEEGEKIDIKLVNTRGKKYRTTDAILRITRYLSKQDEKNIRNEPCLSGCNPHPLYVGCAVIRQARVSEWKLMF